MVGSVSHQGVFSCTAIIRWIVALTLSLGTASVYGQATAQIQGIVADPTGSALPDADIKATQTDTGIERSVTTGPDGTYVSAEPAHRAVSPRPSARQGLRLPRKPASCCR